VNFLLFGVEEMNTGTEFGTTRQRPKVPKQLQCYKPSPRMMQGDSV